MNGESNNDGGYIVIPKKSKLVDEDSNQKKGKYNKRNKQKNGQHTQEQIRQIQDQIKYQKQLKRKAKTQLSKRQQIQTEKLWIEQSQKLSKNIKKMVSMFPDHLPSTLQRVYKQQNSSIQQAILYVADHVPPDAMFNSLNKEKQQQFNSFLAQLANLDQYSQNLEINGKQFEQLFEQISQMIKDDQSQKGVAVFEINDFIDQCESAKKAVIVGLRQQLFGQENIYENLKLDENSLIVQQTEQFIWQISKKAALDSQRRDQDFPALGSNSNNHKISNKQYEKNIFQRIEMQSKQEKMKGQKTNFQPQGSLIYIAHDFKKSNQHSIYNIDNSYQSEAAMKQLAKEYNNVSLDILAFIYKRFQGDFNTCKSFLQKYYKDYRTETIVQVERKSPKKNPYLSQGSRKNSYEEIERLDGDLMKMSLKEIREQMEHLLKLRHVFKMTKANITNSKNRQKLERLSNQNLPLLKKMSDVSRYKLIEEMRISDPLRVDLHGYRVDQVSAIMDAVLAMIRKQYNQSNPKVLSAIKRKNEATLIVVTGKGMHSRQYGMSVLKPAVQEWCDSKGIKSYLGQGSVQVFILL